MDHARSQTKAMLIRLQEAEKEFIAEAVELQNAKRGHSDPRLSGMAFVRGSAIESAERVLGRKFALNGESRRPTKKGKAK